MNTVPSTLRSVFSCLFLKGLWESINKTSQLSLAAVRVRRSGATSLTISATPISDSCRHYRACTRFVVTASNDRESC